MVNWKTLHLCNVLISALFVLVTHVFLPLSLPLALLHHFRSAPAMLGYINLRMASEVQLLMSKSSPIQEHSSERVGKGRKGIIAGLSHYITESRQLSLNRPQ